MYQDLQNQKESIQLSNYSRIQVIVIFFDLLEEKEWFQLKNCLTAQCASNLLDSPETTG